MDRKESGREGGKERGGEQKGERTDGWMGGFGCIA